MGGVRLCLVPHVYSSAPEFGGLRCIGPAISFGRFALVIDCDRTCHDLFVTSIKYNSGAQRDLRPTLNLIEESHVWGTKHPAAVIAVTTRRPSGDGGLLLPWLALWLADCLRHTGTAAVTHALVQRYG